MAPTVFSRGELSCLGGVRATANEVFRVMLLLLLFAENFGSAR